MSFSFGCENVNLIEFILLYRMNLNKLKVWFSFYWFSSLKLPMEIHWLFYEATWMFLWDFVLQLFQMNSFTSVNMCLSSSVRMHRRWLGNMNHLCCNCCQHHSNIVWFAACEEKKIAIKCWIWFRKKQLHRKNVTIHIASVRIFPHQNMCVKRLTKFQNGIDKI